MANSTDPSGFVLTLIKKSYLAPHQTVPDLTYCMRAGSSFVKVPHAVLSGMFGTRPSPDIFAMFSIEPPKIQIKNRMTGVLCKIGFMLSHTTPAIAKDIYFGAVAGGGGKNCEIGWIPDSQSGMWDGNFMFGVKLNLITKEHVRLPPQQSTQPAGLHLYMIPPFEDLWCEIYYGCAGSPIKKLFAKIEAKDIEQLWNEFKIESRPVGPIESTFLEKLILRQLQSKSPDETGS